VLKLRSSLSKETASKLLQGFVEQKVLAGSDAVFSWNEKSTHI